MIREIELRGFKCFEKATVFDLKPLTMLTGLNSSGKSSVIQALLMAERAIDSHRVAGLLLPYETGPRELINDNSKEYAIKLTDERDGKFSFCGVARSISTQFKKSKETNEPLFKMPKTFYSEAGRYGSRPQIPIDETYDGIKPNGDNLIWYIENHRGDIVPEKLRHPDSEGETLLMNLRAWLGIISPGVRFDYNLDFNNKIATSSFDEHRAVHAGFGLSYSLSLIAQILSAATEDGDSLLLLENPEGHLHPKGQTEMGKLIAACADCGVNIVLETHSDHLFDGIRIYAKHNPGFAEKFVGYWLQHSKNKSTTVERILLENDGRYAEIVPEGFFDQFEINSVELMS